MELDARENPNEIALTGHHSVDNLLKALSLEEKT